MNLKMHIKTKLCKLIDKKISSNMRKKVINCGIDNKYFGYTATNSSFGYEAVMTVKRGFAFNLSKASFLLGKE